MQVQCKVLKVSRSAFYKWRNAQPAPASIRREQLKQHIKAVHNEPRKDDYGSPRIHRELLKRNVKCSKNTVAKLMKQQGIRARTARTFRVKTTDSKHDQPIAKNLLNRVFEAQNVNAVWLTDFTYIDCKEGFVYLCTVQDLCSRPVFTTHRRLGHKQTHQRSIGPRCSQASRRVAQSQSGIDRAQRSWITVRKLGISIIP